jgi:protein phosphatase
MMFGGALVGGSIAKEQLFHLKVEGTKAIWTEVKTTGDKPGPRYGHALAFCKPNLILFGGSTGTETMNDTWCLNISEKTLTWSKLEISGILPSPRVYHSADLCQYGGASGMIIVFGGRDVEGRTLNEVWGLRKHRDGKWDWTRPPEKQDSVAPLGRYQHRSIFFGSLMFNIGGKINESICNNLFSVYDYEYNKWYTASGPECFRHITWISKDKLYVHGGLDNRNKIFNKGEIVKYNLFDVFKDYPELTKKIKFFVDTFAPIASPLTSRSTSPNSTNTSVSNSNPYTSDRQMMGRMSMGNNSGNNPNALPVPDPKLKRPAKSNADITVVLPKKINNVQKPSNNDLCNYFIENLLRPKTYANLAPDADFMFKNEEIIELCNQAEAIIKDQATLVEVETPVKIFGDIHGQYADMMRFFDLLGGPCNPEEEGGMEMEDNYSYLFLGDYVDRGNHSLETITLLLALKIKFPKKIYLLRGNHEDRWINQSFGFFDECEQRLQENPDLPDSVFNRINNLFEYLPLAGVIDSTILCIHGGIGSSVKRLDQIANLQRPIEVIHEVQTALEKLVVDILWSDPTDHDGELGVQPNHVRDPHGTGNIVKFGPDVVKDFLQRNNLQKIIRAHECVMDGFERFAGGDLITVFSATDYCGKHKNAGAILVITKWFDINPKLIYPNLQQSNWIDEDENGYRPPTPPRWAGNPQANY